MEFFKRILALKRLRGYLTLVGAFIMHLTLGTIYTYANISTYLVSYLHHYNPSIGFKSAAWIYSSGVTGTSAFMWTGGYLEKWIGTRPTILFGGLLYSVPVFLTAFTCKNFIATLVLFGLIPGIGTGIAYGATISCGVRWFPSHSGLVSGIILSGYGLGTMIFNPIVTQLVNPDNRKIADGQEYYPIEDLGRLPYSLIVLGVSYAILQLMSVFLISIPKVGDLEDEPSEAKLLENVEEGANSDLGGNAKKSTEIIEDGGLEPMEALKTKQFFLIWVVCGINSLSMTTMSSFWKVLFRAPQLSFCSILSLSFSCVLKKLGLVNVTSNDFILAMIGSVSSITNAGGRIFWGTFNDHFQYKTTIITIFFLLAIVIASFSFIRSVWMFTIYVCLIYFLNGGNYPQFPSVVSYSFGRKRFQVIYGYIVTAQIITSNLASLLANALLDTLGLESIFLVVSLFLLTGGLVTLLFYTPFNWKNSIDSSNSLPLPATPVLTGTEAE